MKLEKDYKYIGKLFEEVKNSEVPPQEFKVKFDKEIFKFKLAASMTYPEGRSVCVYQPGGYSVDFLVSDNEIYLKISTEKKKALISLDYLSHFTSYKKTRLSRVILSEKLGMEIARDPSVWNLYVVIFDPSLE